MASTSRKSSEIVRLNEEIRQLKVENKMFGTYLDTHVEEHELNAAENLNISSKEEESGGFADVAYLTSSQKIEISSVMVSDKKMEMKSTTRSTEKLIQTLMAVLEETDLRIAELRKEAYEFKRDVVVGAENPRTGKISAEKVIRYFDDKLRQKDAAVEKLKLKNASMRSQISKMEQQLKNKEEMGDVLHYIDFHQLQIENKQNVAKIEKRNRDLLNAKISTGNIVQILNEKKAELSELEKETEWIVEEMKTRKQQLKRVSDECERVKRAAVRRKEKMESTKRATKNVEEEEAEEEEAKPQILDYVKQKALVYELEAEIKDWQRKIEIASISRLVKKKKQQRSSRSSTK